MGSGRDALDRWIASGGHWRVVAEGGAGEAVTVALLTCDGGEEMDRVLLDPVELPDLS